MMASADDGNGNQHGKNQINIEKAENVHVANEAVMISGLNNGQVQISNLPKQHPENMAEGPNQLDTNLGNARLQQSDHNQEIACQTPSSTGESMNLEADCSQELEGKIDKSTDTRDDWVYARGHSMGEAKRLHFCYHQGPDFLQIANCCTYIELNINQELLQNLCSQGHLTVEIPLPNGQTLVTLKWGSLEAKREYIRCELKAELLGKCKSFNLEKEYLKSLLCNSDCEVEKLVEYFYQLFDALILEIESGCLLFKILVADKDAMDRLYNSESLDSIAKFLDDLLLTDEVRLRTDGQQVLFKVRPINKWFRARPDAKHMIQFDTRTSRELFVAPTETKLTHLIKKIVSQELQASLSQLQVSMTDKIARTVVEEMQKSGEFRPSFSRVEAMETTSKSLDLPKQGRSGSAIQDHITGTAPGRASLGHHDTVTGSISPDHSSKGSGITSEVFHSSGQRTSFSVHHTTGSWNTSPEHPSTGPGSISSGRPSAEPGSTPSEGPGAGPGSISPGHLSTGSETFLGKGRTHADTDTLSLSMKEVNRGDRSRRVWIGDSGRHDHKKRSFASIIFDQEDRTQLWPDPAQRAEMEKDFSLKESEDPLDDDIQQDLLCVKKIVDVRRLAKLLTKSQIGESSQNSHAHGLHTILCLDVSESMKGESIKKLTDCAKKFRDEIEDNTVDLYLEENVGVVSIGGDVNIQLLPTNDYIKLEETIKRLNVKGEACPLLEGLIASILLLFRTDQDPYFTIGEYHHYCLYPRIILMSDGLTTEGGPVRGMDDITDEVLYAVCTNLPSLLKASNNICRISSVQLGNKKKCRSMIKNLSQETGGDAVDPTQVQWLSNYFRLQNAIGKVLDWYASKKDVSNSEVEERIGEEFSDSIIVDKREQEHIREEVLRFINTGPKDILACGGSPSAAGSHGVDTSVTPLVLKPGDKVRLVPEKSTFEEDRTDSGRVISINQKEYTVKVKWSNGTEDYYKYNNLQLEAVHQTKPSEISNLLADNNDLQVDCDPDSDTEDHDQYPIEADVAPRHHHSPYSRSSSVETDLDHKIVWQRKVRGDRWEMYSPKQIEVIEKSYTSRSESCVIGSPDQQIKYRIDFTNQCSTNLSDNSCCEIRRSEMAYNEYAQKFE